MAWSENGYLQTVKDIATDAIAEYPFTLGLDNDDRNQFVQESVDGNEYVIYYAAQDYALSATENEPWNGDEAWGWYVNGMSGHNEDWRTMKTTATYLAMECDVTVEITNLYHAAPTR